MDISIIIPARNGEKYLKECLDSVFNQSFKGEYEIFLEIDPSTDRTVQIANEYKEKHSNLIVDLHNGLGIQGSRNYAVKKSKAKYICFLDVDDCYEKDYLKVMFEEIEKGYDVVNCSFKTEKNGKKHKNLFVKNKSFDSVGACKALLKDTYMRSFLWSKIFKRELLLGAPIIDTTNAIFEDTVAIYSIYMNAEKVKTIKNPLYIYRIHSASSTQTEKKERFDYHLWAFSYIRYLCDKSENPGYLQGFFRTYQRSKLSLFYDAHVSRHVLGHGANKHLKLHKNILKDLKKKEKLDITKYPEIQKFILETVKIL